LLSPLLRLNQNKRSRTRQCKFFAETGSCKYDKACKYAHVVGAKAGEDVSARMDESLSVGQAAAAELEAAAAAATPAAPAEDAAMVDK
jgi:hypothetical protein